MYNSALRAPWYLDEDVAFTKRLFFGERFNADLTVQWFNLFNRNLLSNGSGVNCFHNNVVVTSQFGSAINIGGGGDQTCQGNTPRRGQFQLQFNF